LKRERFVTILYTWKLNENGLPLFDDSQEWATKHVKNQQKIGKSGEIREDRYHQVVSVKLLCNSRSWEVKMNVEWFAQRRLHNGELIGLSNELQYCA
jgi:hypothetical protein